MQYEVRHTKNYGYYIELNSIDNYDELLAKKCGLDKQEYVKMLKINFNGSNDNYMHEIFFKNKNDAKRALEWVMGRTVMHALTGGE